MRSITVTMWVTLDGIVQGPGRPDEDTRGEFTHGGWGQRYNDEVMGREMATAMAKPGDMLFGRSTWHDFITAWGGLTDGNRVTARVMFRSPLLDRHAAPAACEAVLYYRQLDASLISYR